MAKSELDTTPVDIDQVEDKNARHGPDFVVAAHVKDESSEEADNFIQQMERHLAPVAKGPGFFRPILKDPRHFTWIMVIFASMGGLLFGLDQSLISGANLTLPTALHLDSQQISLVNSFMPLGAVVLSPSVHQTSTLAVEELLYSPSSFTRSGLLLKPVLSTLV
jgi:hypothetical protein